MREFEVWKLLRYFEKISHKGEQRNETLKRAEQESCFFDDRKYSIFKLKEHITSEEEIGARWMDKNSI